MARLPWIYEVVATPEQSDEFVRFMIERGIKFDVTHEGDSDEHLSGD